jgi:hypothetical protein
MKMFGVLDLATEIEGFRFSIGLRNSHDKSMRLAMTCGYRVFVCSNMAFSGDFTPVLAKHSKLFSLIDRISVRVDRMQRNFEPMRNQVETWQRSELTDVTAKVLIYRAFVQGKLKAPKQLARTLHDRTEVRRIPAANNLESLERVHVRIQKNSIRCRNSRPQRSWSNSWNSGSHCRSNAGAYRPGPLLASRFVLCRWSAPIDARLTRATRRLLPPPRIRSIRIGAFGQRRSAKSANEPLVWGTHSGARIRK